MSARILHLHRATVVDAPDTVICDESGRPVLSAPLAPYACIVVTGDGQRLEFTTMAESRGAAELNALSGAHPHGVRFLDVKPVLRRAVDTPEGNAMDEYDALQAAELDSQSRAGSIAAAVAVGAVILVAACTTGALIASSHGRWPL